MLTPKDFILDTTISFNLYPAAILGAAISRVKVTDVLSYDTARLFVPDLPALHASVYPFLPSGVPNDPTKYKYIKIILPDGKPYAYGIPWIVDGSVEIANGTSIQLTIDDVTPEQQAHILQVLSYAGYSAVGVTHLTGTNGSVGSASGLASGA